MMRAVPMMLTLTGHMYYYFYVHVPESNRIESNRSRYQQIIYNNFKDYDNEET